MNRNVNKGLIPLAVFALFCASCEQPSGGPGMPPPVVRDVGTAADMAKIGRDPAWPLDGVYTLTADIVLTGWSPPGTYRERFSGDFDGGDHTVTITGEGGLFGYVSGAVIRRVKVAGTITRTGVAAVFAGGIAAYAENTAIRSCESGVTIAVTANGHNSSAGGILGYGLSGTVIEDCSSTADITLRSAAPNRGLMLYGGGIAGYMGTGTDGGGASGCEIVRCAWSGGVRVSGGYPYAGGIAGYNYTGAKIRESAALSGTVRAEGENLPYSGGVAGYNSGFVVGAAITALIEDCYAAAGVTVEAVSGSKYALAGGIAGANAKRAVISRCYALGDVVAAVVGDSLNTSGGSLGPPPAASAGGIAGAQYFETGPRIENCAALNGGLEGRDDGSGAVWNVRRVAGRGDSGGVNYDTGVWSNNAANAAMTITLADGGVHVPDTGPDGRDGADTPLPPDLALYADTLRWDFAAVWKMRGGYPVLRWQP